MTEGNVGASLALGVLDSGNIVLNISPDIDDSGWKL